MKFINKNIVIKLILLLIILFYNNSKAKTFLLINNDSTIVKSNSDKVEKILDSKVREFAKKGYPYAKIILEKYEKKDENDLFKFRVQKGEYVTIDTIVYGKYKEREVNIIERNITELPLGEYNYLKADKAIHELKQINYLSVSNRKNIYKTGLRLYTKPKNKAKLDALLSYKKETDESGIIGNFSIEMQNLFGLGRYASLSWYRPNFKTNRIKLNYFEPYIFNSGFSVMGEYFQDFHDTLYVKRDIDLHIYYQFNPKLQLGYINSLENIYSSEGGEKIGYKSMKQYGTRLRIDGKWGKGIVINDFFGEIGMKNFENDKMYFSSIFSNLIIRYKKIGANIKVKYAIVDSKSEIKIYDIIKLGGADFLRGAYFEQYLTEEYYGLSFEFGVFSGRSNLLAFYDLGILRELNSPTNHIGLSVKLPTGASSVSLTIGFNLDESYENGKVHLKWNL